MKMKQGLGVREILFNDEKLKLKSNIGQIADYREDMFRLKSKAQEDSKSVNELDILKVMNNYAKLFITQANPQIDDKELTQYMEEHPDLTLDVLESFGLINTKNKDKEEKN
ncbi:MAG: hypothetical protein EOL97_09605 [Spirochaetia bacterium]|nr:hypothetical protein [Spirochaetia bacterium]